MLLLITLGIGTLTGCGVWLLLRARSFDAFLREVVDPLARLRGRPLRVLDLGAGNGWLCYRVHQRGHRALALDVRTDAVDGLGAGAAYRGGLPVMFSRVAGSFERLPLAEGAFDVAVFNASLHYALDLARVVRGAVRAVAGGGRVVECVEGNNGVEEAGCP